METKLEKGLKRLDIRRSARLRRPFRVHRHRTLRGTAYDIVKHVMSSLDALAKNIANRNTAAIIDTIFQRPA